MLGHTVVPGEDDAWEVGPRHRGPLPVGRGAPDAEDGVLRAAQAQRIVGAQGIVDFYTGVFEHIAEELEVLDLIVAPDGDKPPAAGHGGHGPASGQDVREAPLVADLAQALLHRGYHRIPFLWRFHRVHHVDPDLERRGREDNHPIPFPDSRFSCQSFPG